MLSTAINSPSSTPAIATQRAGLYTAGQVGQGGDTANISDAGRALSDTLSAGRTLMSGTTQLGSSITLQSHQSSNTNGMAMGLAANQP